MNPQNSYSLFLVFTLHIDYTNIVDLHLSRFLLSSCSDYPIFTLHIDYTSIVDLHLSRFLLSSCSDYPNWVCTVQLEYFCWKHTFYYIKVFECSSLFKCMGFNYPNFLIT